MFGRIVLALILLLVALFAGLLACAYDPGYSSKSDKEFEELMQDQTSLPGCLLAGFIITFGALLLLGLMWVVFGWLGADPDGMTLLPWMPRG